MPIPRYFKLKDFIVKPGFDLELSEIRFVNLAGSNLTYTVTSNKTPKSGALNNLKDSNNTTICAFNVTDLKTLEININFGSTLASTLTALLFGSSDSQDTFPLYCTVITSTDNTNWTDYLPIARDYPLRKLHHNGVSAFQSVAALSARDRMFNFNDVDPTFFRIDLDKDGYYRGTSLYYGQWNIARPSLCKPLRTGKWYMEITGNDVLAGIAGNPEEAPKTQGFHSSPGSLGVGFSDTICLAYSSVISGGFFGSGGVSRPNTSESRNTPFGICIDLDNLRIYVVLNNVISTEYSDIPPSATGEYYPAVSAMTTGNANFMLNLGAAPFKHTVPVGYSPMSDYAASVFAFSTLSAPYATKAIVSKPKSKTLQTKASTIPKSLIAGKTAKAINEGRNIGYIRGNVYIDSVPKVRVRKFVSLVDMRTGRTMDSVWSNAATGDYQFNNVDISRKYVTWTYDNANVLAPTISGPLTPQKMPIFTN